MSLIADWLKKSSLHILSQSEIKETLNMRVRVFPRLLAAASEVTSFSANDNREKVIVIGSLAFSRAFRGPRVFA